MKNKTKKRGHITVKQVIIIIAFGFVVTLASCIIGYIVFTNAIQQIYSNESSQIADYLKTDINNQQMLEQTNALIEKLKTTNSNEEYDAYVKALQEQADFKQFSNELDLIREKFDCWGIEIFVKDNSLKELYDQESTEESEFFITYDSSFSPEFLDSNGESSSGPGIVFEMDKEDLEAIRKVYEDGSEANVDNSLTTLESKNGPITYRTVTFYEPIKNDRDEVIGIISIDKSVNILYSARLHYISLVGIYSFIISIIFVILFFFINRRLFTQPIKRITEDTKNFVRNNTQVSTTLKDIKTNDEIQDLAESILKLEKDVNDYIDNLEAITTERERVRTELDLATKIQSSMLPQTFPAFPERDDFDVHALMNPAREVGGDFYNFFLIDEDHLGIVVGDVSGKGIPASLFMAIGNILIRAFSLPGEKVNNIVEKVNDILSSINSQFLFITSWMGIYEFSTREITFVNAGHEPPIVVHKDGSYEFIKTKPNMVLASFEGIPYRLNRTTLQKGDKLILYTDGVTEAQGEAEILYGKERFIKAVQRVYEKSLKEIIEYVENDINEFTNNAAQFDDITLVALEIKE